MGLLSNKISRDELKPGDHIYSWRQAYIYAHHGIYVGEGKVIHFTRGVGQKIGTGAFLDRLIFSSCPAHPSDNPCPDCGDQSKLNGVICSCINCFLAGGDLYLCEYGVSYALFLAKPLGGTCTLATADSQENVLHRAHFLLKNGFGGYNTFRNNCEDFAVYCKTGRIVVDSLSVGRSGQAASLAAAANSVLSPLIYVTTSCSVLAAVGFGKYCVSRLRSDIGVRQDAVIVPVERLITHASVDASDTATAESEMLTAAKEN